MVVFPLPVCPTISKWWALENLRRPVCRPANYAFATITIPPHFHILEYLVGIFTAASGRMQLYRSDILDLDTAREV